jgi:hypothetical protein
VLHVYVSDLRRSLPDEILVTAPPGYLGEKLMASEPRLPPTRPAATDIK